MRPFHHVLVNTLLANITTSYLWFCLAFWVYLETRNVGLTGAINGLYMALIATGSIFFGSVVDHHRKKTVMMLAAVATLVAFALAALVWVLWVDPTQVRADDPAIIAFAVIILVGAVVEHMRNIALSTTVTLMVPEAGRDKANGLVGMVQGLAFSLTSVISGLSIGYLGMEISLWIAVGLTVVALVHLLPLKITETQLVSPEATEDAADVITSGIDLRGSWAVIRLVPGLLALILFSSFNNLMGGVYTALMDPYGLEMYGPQLWGVVLAVTSVGFILGGALVAKVGLGGNPVRTLLLVNLAVAAIGATFALREWWWLFAAGMLAFMSLMPAAEAAEQTILQRVVPFRQQGRVFGLAIAIEMVANPVSAITVAVLAQSYVIPWMSTPAGWNSFGRLLGGGETRGMALMFTISGAVMFAVVVLAFFSRPYHRLSEYYASTSQDVAGQAGTGVS
ncbi:MFS transporter [Corynebacterium comes]|uniref:Major Facilitator Superfamily protein n=1 Tax=Corynebacterium comes TaxID=2675218 RepID=A0A6B8W0V6_9CORY|nr:MFS transporter [Corynebacterium comes]QGU05637.1 Major Facilitator Superfamily protein [Corynebacterium comes]